MWNSWHNSNGTRKYFLYLHWLSSLYKSKESLSVCVCSSNISGNYDQTDLRFTTWLLHGLRVCNIGFVWTAMILLINWVTPRSKSGWRYVDCCSAAYTDPQTGIKILGVVYTDPQTGIKILWVLVVKPAQWHYICIFIREWYPSNSLSAP